MASFETMFEIPRIMAAFRVLTVWNIRRIRVKEYNWMSRVILLLGEDEVSQSNPPNLIRFYYFLYHFPAFTSIVSWHQGYSRWVGNLWIGGPLHLRFSTHNSESIKTWFCHNPVPGHEDKSVAHATTYLLYNVSYYGANISLGFRWKQREISIKFELLWKNL